MRQRFWHPVLLRSLLAVAGFCFSPAVQSGGRDALVIGNDAYEHARPLANPCNDATAMAKLLRNLGFTVTFRTDADLKSMKGALREFVDGLPRERDPDAVALVYFAGHGVQIDGKNYLIPVDAEMARDYEVPDETLSMDSIMGGLESAGAGLNLLVLDCCRNNPFSRSWRGSRSASSTGLAMPAAAPQGMFIAFSTSPGDVADDGEGNNSPYTEALLKHLPEPGRAFEEAFKRVGGEVATKTSGLQEPWFNSKFYGSFQFVPEGATLPGVTDDPNEATKDSPWENTLGLEFLPLPGKPGVLMARTETRVRDFQAFVNDTDYVQKGAANVLSIEKRPDGVFTTKWIEKADAGWDNPGFEQSIHHPVVCVNWHEAKAFCEWLSKKEGKTYRLPTDSEWSAAVGSATKFPWGNAWPPPARSGNYWDLKAVSNLPGDWSKSIVGGVPYNDGAERTARVGSYPANVNGFHDLGGNVWEWLSDDYSPTMNTPDALRANDMLLKERDDNGLPFKSMRGGAWDSFESLELRSDLRDFDAPDRRDDDYGFRIVLELD
ncbi:MAG: hypothetical protein CMO55_10410 [Verrucomicrobiales bacterium]|nr:hypothetical protein [Verrucomicrobiales bacterium]